jgi:hypothetical protein
MTSNKNHWQGAQGLKKRFDLWLWFHLVKSILLLSDFMKENFSSSVLNFNVVIHCQIYFAFVIQYPFQVMFINVMFLPNYTKYDKKDQQGKAAYNERNPHRTQHKPSIISINLNEWELKYVLAICVLLVSFTFEETFFSPDNPLYCDMLHPQPPLLEELVMYFSATFVLCLVPYPVFIWVLLGLKSMSCWVSCLCCWLRCRSFLVNLVFIL